MSSGKIILDSDCLVTGIDQNAAQLFGYDDDEYYSQPLSLFISDFDESEYKLEQLSLDGQPMLQQGKTKNGSTFSLSILLHTVKQKDETAYIVELNERNAIFPRIRQQSSINQSQGQDWLSYLLRSSPVVIYSCIPSGNFDTTFISENIATLTGYTPSQYLASPSFWLEHLHPEDKDILLSEMSELFTTDESHSYEYRFLCADGSYIWVLDKLKISRDSEGQPSEMVGLWLDITDRKQDEDALTSTNMLLKQKSDALKESNTELSQFTYVVSHDLKAPLRAIHSYCGWLSDDLDGNLDPDQQEYITGMQDAVQQAESLIDDLLELSRVGRRSAQVETIHLTDFFNNLTRSLITDDLVKIKITEGMPTIEVSPIVLTQVFQNLITNAYTYNTSENKTITIDGQLDGSEYIVSIVDNGIGIDEKFHARVFQLFQRLHTKEEYDGTGIGLAIVQKAVMHLNWSISLNSTLNQGSTFAIAFPIEEIIKK